MKPALQRLLSDYGMIFVLLLLCVFFSTVTLTEQTPTGETAVHQVASDLVRAPGKGGQVLIAARSQAEDTVFARALEQELTAAGLQVTVAIGEPRDAREVLQKLAATNKPLDAIAGNQVTAAWLVFSDIPTDFPALGHPRIVKPRTYRWPNFLKSENLLNIANQIAVIAIIAIGMTMVIITAGIDLSVGSLIALSAVLAARFIRDYAGATHASTTGMTIACLAAILLCGLVGAFSGGMITLFRIPPFIVTLAMMLVGSGLAYLLAQGQSIYQIPDSFVWLGRGADFLHIPNAVLLMLVLYGLAHVVMSRMRLGRYLYAVGGNREAARLSGVPVRRVLLFAYAASGLLAGLGGVIMASQLKSGSPTYGNMYELYIIAAVVVGGTSLSGGEGRMLGTLVGAFTIAVIQNGMNLTNVESYTHKVVLGLVILVAVLLDTLRHRRWRRGEAAD
ncbi:Monosaccharide-transporting ATPase [Chthoniobacter flavus Ellin428]|uniref:Monosaccharide-transporting ATPase n=1 Tax=Chthoniobacter flavus Ellin428 TaxID=497964 RepID=B4DBL3_9BACT|nr:ABC transporter permease [Chthoniobacter flavus]EDY16200.1 Monosaccharide-transporting ATPase [Chthoniobacter flavus Ellin428]